MLFLALFIATIGFSSKDSIPSYENPVSTSTLNKTVMLQLVNNARKKGCNCGNKYYPPVAALTWNNQLERAAYGHSTDMFRNRYFSHTGSNGSATGERITNAGYNWRFFGENIAQGYPSEKEVVAGWLSSPGHCANIMSKNYKEMGAARVGDYWTQDFGSAMAH
ncbi:MAG: CAP domain-containing protein [Flavisolibacter sp.]